MDLLDLSGKHVLITGGCGAIGRVVIQALAEHGATVSVNDRLPTDEAQRVLAGAGAQGPNVWYYQADVTNVEEVARLLRDVQEQSGVPQIVCCHAGITEAHPIERFPAESFDMLVNVNLRSAFLFAQAAARIWIA